MKYKAAYYNYEDLKKKMDEKRCADEQTRKKIITTHAELKKKLKNLINEADNEFISVVQNMTRFFLQLNMKHASIHLGTNDRSSFRSAHSQIDMSI